MKTASNVSKLRQKSTRYRGNLRPLSFDTSTGSWGLKVGLEPSIPISTVSPADCWQEFPAARERNICGGSSFSLNIPVVNRAQLHWVIAVPCGINNTGGRYCPSAGHSIIQLKQVQGGGGGSFHTALLGFRARRQRSASGEPAAVPLHRAQL